MPTPQAKHRTYCKSCKDFKIHSWNKDKELKCDICSTTYTPYHSSEVEPDLVKQQRERYKAMKVKNFGGIYRSFMRGVGIEAILELDSIRQDIIECDAGEEKIREEKNKERELIKQRAQEILDDYNNNYKKLNRNDKCSCGSGKKFKQCHLQYFNQYLKL